MIPLLALEIITWIQSYGQLLVSRYDAAGITSDVPGDEWQIAF